MSDNLIENDEDFLDAVAEVLNIGMGYAASVLSEMVNEEVKLSVPGVTFVSRPEALKVIQAKTDRDVSGVCQQFDGVMGGDVLLLFPEEKSLQLVRAVLQQDLSLEDLTEMEQEAMAEIGNVILNGCLCSIADLFNQRISGGIPEFVKGSLADILADNELREKVEACVLLLNMEFSLDKNRVEGYVTFLMDVESMSIFKQSVKSYLGM
ncbi:chemotaxis protein CheX [Methylomonas sp. EFPC3]|uniref:chemotaxis protein CheX n=1 Tax=Methylomonas sp. EFPC3 TaxID=3021710 RepID=UPI002417CD3E|nr:chemotaxis protein CheX [Methylomonas sp. EFPC3]WFP51122.1 chemotaxis protein CheX [Methylomonas sp. EFPC3]